ncbi:MAG: anoctamin [Streptococcus sp.]|nr:anoctamin [Streptococcus sp.]
MTIWQFLCVISVVSNCLILLISSNMKETFSSDKTDYFWLIFAYENSILALKLILAVLIADMPEWVKKELVRIRSE